MRYIYHFFTILCIIIATPFGLISAIFLFLGQWISDKNLKRDITHYPDGSYTVRGSDHIYNNPNQPVTPKPEPIRKLIKSYKVDMGKCVERNCTRDAVIDYNEHKHYVCQQHYDSLTRFFEEEYD